MNRVNALFNIKYPIIQGGMVWCSGWKLASAVSNAGGLGLIGSGSMRPNVLRKHIQKCKNATKNPFGINIPLLYPYVEEHIDIIVEEGIKIVFTSAGNPLKYTSYLKSKNIKVAHVVSSEKFAFKALNAGVNALVVEGFEAGGHNGINETTTMCLVPNISRVVDIPIIAAGGIGSGKTMLAALVLGADGVQIGSRFAVCKESSAHPHFKDAVHKSIEGDTQLTLKELVPVRLLKNDFYYKIKEAYKKNKNKEELALLLGKGRARKGIFEGNLLDGELEIGQISSMLNKNESVLDIINEIVADFNLERIAISDIKF